MCRKEENGMQVAILLGGLGLFLYGMRLLGAALTQLAAQKQPTRATWGHASAVSGAASGAARPFLFPAFLRQIARGAVVTAVVQSSGAVALFALSAADAGLLAPFEAIGLCWGANLGTTMTGHLLALASLASSEKAHGQPGLLPALICPLCCFVGVAMQLITLRRDTAKPSKLALAGQALLGFGLLFTGLDSVQSALASLLRTAWARAFFRAAQTSFPLAFAFGLLLAVGLQSSSAALGLAQAAASGGGVLYAFALPFVLGINVGTCSTILLAALALNPAQRERKAARQVALGHLGFNLFGCAVASLGYLCTAGLPFWQTPAGFHALAWLQTAFNAGTLALAVAAVGLFRLRPKPHASSARLS
jgi:phosphate:Na+ symporter